MYGWLLTYLFLYIALAKWLCLSSRATKNFLDKHNILFKSQYGFREKHSTQHAIIDIVNIIQNNMDLKLFTCGIFLDLKKSFDTVNHLILLKKLNHYSIRGIIYDWFSWYLLGRSQVTEIDSILIYQQLISHVVSHKALFLVLCYS